MRTAGVVAERGKEGVAEMSKGQEPRIVYVAHPASGLARSNFPIVCHVENGRIARCLPFRIPDDVRLYEIETSRGVFTRPRKEVQMPLAYAWKRRVDSHDRVRFPLLRDGWSPRDRRPERRGVDGYSRISWDHALDIVVSELERVREMYGSMEPVLVQADGHGQSGYLQSLHFWGSLPLRHDPGAPWLGMVDSAGAQPR